MNKELFVSSTPHETKVGLVEDDLLAEVYLERENEYTLAGSIYKGRVTRVLPGMQSAFVDIGLERDAFLYVSDFMDLEEHDDDLTEVVPANRGVQDMRPQQSNAENAGVPQSSDTVGVGAISIVDTDEGTDEADTLAEGQPASAAEASESAGNGDSQSRDRGNWRGRRRRRGGRRDGRERGSERSNDRGSDRGSERTSEPAPEPRYSRPAEPSAPRTPSGPPPGYQPILLPGESISKYQRYQQPPQAHEASPKAIATEAESEDAEEIAAPLAASFPEDEPVFASTEAIAEPLHEEHDHASHDHSALSEEQVESASTSVEWNREFRNPELAAPVSIEQPFDLNAARESHEDTHEDDARRHSS